MIIDVDKPKKHDINNAVGKYISMAGSTIYYSSDTGKYYWSTGTSYTGTIDSNTTEITWTSHPPEPLKWTTTWTIS